MMGELNRFTTIPDVTREDILSGTSGEVNYCNLLLMDPIGIPIMVNESYAAAYHNPIEITSGFYSAIECISKEIKGRVLDLLTFSDGSSTNMINFCHGGSEYKLCVEPSRNAPWLLPRFLREILMNKMVIYQNSNDLEEATKTFYKEINIAVHKGTIAAILFAVSGAWQENDVAVMSSSGFLVFREGILEDHRKWVEEYRKIISSVVEARVKGIVQFEGIEQILRVVYTLQLYHIKLFKK